MFLLYKPGADTVVPAENQDHRNASLQGSQVPSNTQQVESETQSRTQSTATTGVQGEGNTLTTVINWPEETLSHPSTRLADNVSHHLIFNR